jgi:hypothetical protein
MHALHQEKRRRQESEGEKSHATFARKDFYAKANQTDTENASPLRLTLDMLWMWVNETKSNSRLPTN